ncbi:DUF6882 domain-containing protein [Actinomadura adrarensis]|uniref:DUF6882 domain-containing protein n=1 Tax=Actinomadura adrarensis TaxID=1819600 RepID=A0ABW3CNP0_9ACTN
MTHDHPEWAEWDEYLHGAREQAQVRQDALVKRLQLPADVQYALTMDDARMAWSRNGKEFLIARITMIGSVSFTHGTWLWSWANPSLPRPVLGDIERLKVFGRDRGFPILTTEGLDYHPDMVTELRYVAASVLDAEGLWTEPRDDGETHFLLHDLKSAA